MHHAVQFQLTTESNEGFHLLHHRSFVYILLMLNMATFSAKLNGFTLMCSFDLFLDLPVLEPPILRPVNKNCEGEIDGLSCGANGGKAKYSL